MGGAANLAKILFSNGGTSEVPDSANFNAALCHQHSAYGPLINAALINGPYAMNPHLKGAGGQILPEATCTAITNSNHS